MTERAAREAGRRVKTARLDMRRNGKAIEIGETAGFIKVVVDAETDRLLGAAVLANDGAELVHIYIDLMNAGAPYQATRDRRPHPSDTGGSRPERRVDARLKSAGESIMRNSSRGAPERTMRRSWRARRHWSPAPIPESARRPRLLSGKPVPMSWSIT